MGGNKPKKRKNFYFSRIFVALAVIFSINFVLWQLWQDNLPWLKIIQQKESLSQNMQETNSLDTNFNEITFSEPLLAQNAAKLFISNFPNPGSGWKSYPAEETVKGSILDIVCPDNKVINPIVQTQKEWRATNSPIFTTDEETLDNAEDFTNSDTVKGIVAQVKIYHPGMGGVVFDDLKKQASSCGSKNKWSVNGITSVNSIGQESFTYSYTGDGSRNTATVFREGDILGVVYGTNNIDTVSLARQWNLRWQKDIKKFCLNPKSTIDDAKRQPLYSKYIGFQDEARVSLTAADKSFLSQTVTEKVNQKYGINTDSSNTLFYDDAAAMGEIEKPRLPNAPKLTAGEELEVLNPYQTFLPVSLPTTPKKPLYPQQPSLEPKSEVFYGPAEDVKGPGCGWRLIGQEKPIFDKATYDEQWDAARKKAQDRLEKKYVDWSISTWQYAIDYDEYVYNVRVWNKWVEESNQIIATAEWQKYDEDTQNYPTILEEYETNLDIWRACARDVPLPPPTPIIPEPEESANPDPVEEESGDTPVVVDPVALPSVIEYEETLEERQEIRRKNIIKECGFRPSKPSSPKTPTMPRPEISFVSPSNFEGGILPSIVPNINNSSWNNRVR
jgi:hypothetical protein